MLDWQQPDPNLPPAMHYDGDPELAYSLFMILEAIEWKWTITEVLEQPEALLNDVLHIASRSRKLQRMNDHA